MNRLLTALAALALLGCDALVGGVCAVGYVSEGDACVLEAPSPHDGEGGDTAEGGGGTGGTGGQITLPEGGGGAGEGGGSTCALDLCGHDCVDTEVDPEHCGGCGQHCPSGICIDGACQDDPIGHAVVIGMSYESSTVASRRLLGNAVFLPLPDPLLILDYRQHAVPSVATAVDAAVAEQASLRGRTFERYVAPSHAALDSALDSGLYHLLLIHDQALGPASALSAIGASLEPKLDAFAASGGVIVVLATDEGEAMQEFLSATELLSTTALEPIDGQLLDNAAPTDSIAIGVSPTFVASTRASAFLLDEPTSPLLVPVVTTDLGLPVALHRAYLP